MELVQFLDKENQLQVEDKGFTVFSDLIPAEVCKHLKDFYNSLEHPYEKGFHPSMFWDNPKIKEQISKEIISSISPFFENIFSNHRLLYGNFMVKQPGDESYMKLHQDWTYVDESLADSYAIWFPLVDLNEQNGALNMIPRSHHFKVEKRGPGLKCPFEDHEQLIRENYSKPLNLKTGEVVTWQHRLLHWSPPNFSEKPRIAVTAIVVPKNTDIVHFYLQNDKIEKYLVEEAFYYHYKIFEQPEKYAEKIESMAHNQPVINTQELQQVLGQHKQHQSLKEKLIALFK